MTYLVTHITIESLLALVSLVGLIYVFLTRKVFRKMKETWSLVREIPNAMEKFTEVHGIIMKELRTNGGTSLKDSVNELRITVSALDGKFRAYAAHANIIGWESAKDGRYIWASPAMLAILGRAPDEVLGQAWRSIVAEKDRERVIDEWTDSVNEARSFYMTYSWIHRDGHLIPILAETHPIRDFRGEVYGYVATVKMLNQAQSERANSSHTAPYGDFSIDTVQSTSA